MFIASGALMMEAWDNSAVKSGEVLGSGIMAVINGFVYLADFVLTYFRYR
jgi:hypothetical protein